MKTLIIAPFLEKYADQLEQVGDCLIWTGYCRKDGRPEANMKIDGKWKTVKLSRMVCEYVHGPLGDLLACHECDNSKCLNGAHLNPGTFQKNMDDKLRAGTHNKKERNPMAKLTEKQVVEIKELRGKPDRPSQAAVGKLYGITHQAVSKIERGLRW